MNETASYLAEIELALVSSPILSQFQILRAWANTDDGYIRIRATLINGDFLEATEYFVFQQNRIITIDYRHQWMDRVKQVLRRRWDSTPDHPSLANFPYHMHIGNEKNVVSSYLISLIELLKIIEQEFSRL